MSPWILIVLVVAAVLTATVSAILGMAGGIMLQAVMLFVLPLRVVVPIHGAVQLCSNATRLLVYLKNMELRIVGRFVIGAAAGGLCGWLFLDSVRPLPGSTAERVLEAVIGAVILATTFLPRPKLERRMGSNVYIGVGAAATCIGILIGAVGPFIAPFFVREGMVKERLIATKAACQAVTHVFKIAAFAAFGAWEFAFWPYRWLLISMFAAVVVGTLIGRRLIRYVSPRAFEIAVKVFLALAGIMLLTGLKLPGT